MHTATQTLGDPHSRHSHRKRMAKIYLALISVLICAGDSLLLHFVFSDHNPSPVLLGFLVGQIGSTPFLIASICRRRSWARFVLIGLLFAIAGIFALAAVYIGSTTEYFDPRYLVSITVAVGLLMIANTWLIRSKRIQHLARTGESASA